MMMNNCTSLKVVGIALLASAAAKANPWVTNFTAVTPDGATGVWRNEATATDTTIPVSISGSNATRTPIGNDTVIDDSNPWQDAAPVYPNLFEPNFNGDFIEYKVDGGQTAVVTIEFNAQVVNPVISFTDVDTQTTLCFSSAGTGIAGTPNLVTTATSATTNGVPILGFGEEAAGSFQINGTITSVTITIKNTGSDPNVDDDQTGFVVATTTEPVPIVAGPPPQLSIAVVGPNMVVSWPDTSSFSSIEWAPDLEPASWGAVPSLDPSTTTSWSMPLSSLGDMLYFRGVYAP